MKRNRVSIKYRVLAIFGVFVVGIISFLWLFQIVFLNDFYKFTKVNEIKSSAEFIEKYMGSDNFQEVVSDIAGSQQQCIQLVNLDTNTRVSIEGARNCVISKMTYNSILNYYTAALKNNGQYYEIIKDTTRLDNPYLPSINTNNVMSSLVFTKLTTYNDMRYMLVLNTSISPVDATVNTLKFQLGCISIVLIVVSIILAYYITKKVTKPISDINESAKVLAGGNYDATFIENGYKEIAELGETLNYAANELSKVENLRNELIANISHDLRTPLTMIGGYAQVMIDIPGENNSENLQVIIDETARLTSLVNDVLNISKLQSKTQNLTMEEFDVTQVLIDLKERFMKMLDKDGYLIELNYNENIIIEADEVRITQVIYNLLNNAITYTGEDQLIIINQKIVGDYVRIEVIDHGIGISQENLTLIWDRYYKANNQHKRAVNGSGLGLSIVKSTMELHNAQIPHSAKYGVSSIEQEGSTFYIEYRIKTINKRESLNEN